MNSVEILANRIKEDREYLDMIDANDHPELAEALKESIKQSKRALKTIGVFVV